jgi:hypothetical protein
MIQYNVNYDYSIEASERYYSLLLYDTATNSWTMLEQAGDWISLLGVDSDSASSFIISTIKSFTINDQVYWAVKRDDIEVDSDFDSEAIYSIVSVDKTTGKLVKILDTPIAACIYASSDALYFYIQADSETSDIVSSWVANGAEDKVYFLTYKLDLTSGQTEYVFGMDCNFGLYDLIQDNSFTDNSTAQIFFVGSYLCVTLPFASGSGIAVANLANTNLDQPLVFTYYSSEFMFRSTTCFVAAENYLVCAAVQHVSESNDYLANYATLSYTAIFNPSTGEFTNTQALLSGGIPGYASATCVGDTLYVWGEEDYNLGYKYGEFFRSLSLTQWIGKETLTTETIPTSETDTSLNQDAYVAPCANNAEGAVVAAELADTSDKTNTTALAIAFALSLVACIVARKRFLRQNKSSSAG